MIHLPAGGLAPLEQFGLDLLVDASGLLRVADPSAPVVHAYFTGSSAPAIGEVPSFPGRDGIVEISRPLLARVGEVAGAVAEQRSEARDRHDRVPSSVNAMVAAGQVRLPWINLLGLALRDATLRVAGDRPVRTLAPWPEGKRWAVALSHDLDVVRLWPVFTSLRVLELGRKSELAQAWQSARAAVGSLARNPVREGVERILQVESAHGINSTWCILAGRPSASSFLKGDVTYGVESPFARGLLASIAGGGHELALHGSFATMTDREAMEGERRRLEAVAGKPVRGVRQHFLRMRPGITQRVMRESGFEWDATYGFPDRNGFRLGAATVVPGWDEAAGGPAGLEEVPLAWMDRALSKYVGIENPAAWVEEGLELARAVQGGEGLWVGLWHPNLTGALGYPGAEDEYRRLAETLSAWQPWSTTIGAAVEWRRARRSVIARSLDSAGAPQLEAGISVARPLVLEDGRGNLREQLSWPGAR